MECENQSKKSFFLVFHFVFLTFTHCGPTDTQQYSQLSNTLPVGSSRIATMNLRWLNDQLNTGLVPRSSSDYGAIASVLTSLDAAIIAIQEVENTGAVQNLIINSHLAGKPYSVLTNGEGSQEIGVIWNHSIAVVNKINTPPGFSSFTRTPFFISFRVGDFDGTMVVVHLKAGSDSTSKVQRAFEMNTLQSWSSSFLTNSTNDPDLIILGDYNLNPRSSEVNISSLYTLYAPTSATLVSGTNIVDFVLASADTSEEILLNSVSVSNSGSIAQLYFSYVVSDHWPVKIEINGSTNTRDK